MTGKAKSSEVGKVSIRSKAQASAVRNGKQKAPTAASKPATKSRGSNSPATATRTTKQAVKSARVKNAKNAKVTKPKKPKLVRDSFTMPKSEYEVIDLLKARCLRAGISVKKSQLLRAAVGNLAKLSDTSLVRLIHGLAVIKTGRPKKGK